MTELFQQPTQAVCPILLPGTCNAFAGAAPGQAAALMEWITIQCCQSDKHVQDVFNNKPAWVHAQGWFNHQTQGIRGALGAHCS